MNGSHYRQWIVQHRCLCSCLFLRPFFIAENLKHTTEYTDHLLGRKRGDWINLCGADDRLPTADQQAGPAGTNAKERVDCPGRRGRWAETEAELTELGPEASWPVSRRSVTVPTSSQRPGSTRASRIKRHFTGGLQDRRTSDGKGRGGLCLHFLIYWFPWTVHILKTWISQEAAVSWTYVTKSP